ncbi:MAG TPA: ABC transporter substrate-binding protein [Candidatus Dormibacteraeota bacterium]|nr:ABC transporter substrate-binding protein [Candidatus Dormibacteraeota bacterium]
MASHSISRKSFVKGVGLGAAALSGGFPAFIPKMGEAAEALKIGQIEELTGVYSAVAQDEVRGAAFAVEWWNQKGGVMGRKVEVAVEDNQNNPGVSVEKARKLINEDKVAALMGTVNSAATLSTSNAANALGKVFVDDGGHADQISGADCHWNTFQTCHTTWAITHATGFSIAKLFGKKWYMITPDYAFGHALATGYMDVIKKLGGEIIENDLTPLGTTDFSPYLTKVEAKKPSCLLILVQGEDWVNCLKQAGSFGLLKKIPVAGPYAELESVWAVPPEVRVGYWGTEWYYKGENVLGKNNALATRFISEYHKKYNIPPTPRSCFGYTAMDRLLWAINEAKSTDSVKIAKTLAGAPFHGLWDGTSAYRTVDHSLQWPMWFGKLRPNGTPGDKYDVFDIIDRQEAAGTALTDAEAAKICSLKWPS